MPAMIDTIIEKTGQEKVFYIGHSMGTTSLMVMANDRPEYLEKIYLAHMLAPIAYVDHMTSPIKYLAPFANQIGVCIQIFQNPTIYFFCNNFFYHLVDS